eukprot:Gregarina_sp_Poly_1__10637@NODE_79_length_15751_cov_81_561464_g67_i0_p5_GENE_NODE_79_length_15751_cov_81_561464_g67_i0NODE_79_length_15751_cov_81_561464_g67_i0_p5_ORF_typecomplete_len370_score50_89IBR/PF01485_21/1_8IBR/PF01485_21/1e04IBR/PF01485_21/2_1e05IBR/PF01485_21/1_3e08zfC3HC4_2/PF13923_6/1e05zfC3HC4_2/PF13923_6/1_3e04zfC3HC4_2/PF13923_6/1_2e03zfC3HC4/PF00097_25/0_00024zfC3HC4/PF00097_25/1_8e04zfRING_UBOX/PF13445_6/0_024zfRING_UBOX/PF13445_6/1_8e04zfRING_UBOX/PF13445_6/1_8e04_NODE_79_lengt
MAASMEALPGLVPLSEYPHNSFLLRIPPRLSSVRKQRRLSSLLQRKRRRQRLHFNHAQIPNKNEGFDHVVIDLEDDEITHNDSLTLVDEKEQVSLKDTPEENGDASFGNPQDFDTDVSERRLFPAREDDLPSAQSGDIQSEDSVIPSISVSLASISEASPAVPLQKCAVCKQLVQGPMVQLLCDHWFCFPCLRQYIQVTLSDVACFPPKCCKIAIEIEHAAQVLEPNDLALYRFREQERHCREGVTILYCPNRNCGEIVPCLEAESEAGWAQCFECEIMICLKCNQEDHPGLPCGEDDETREVRKRAAEAGWKECAQCHAVVEFTIGCWHMTCRCGYQFCYNCGQKWKTCGCPVWEESKLLAQRMHEGK